MYIRYLGLVLLILFPGVLQAQSGTQSCSAPSLVAGFFTPKQQTYSHGTKLTYTCNDGYKPAAEGWWAKSTCQNGRWSHQPQCIDEKSCIPPTIPNGNYPANRDGWYQNGHVMRTTCDRGYKHRDNNTTAVCFNGTWTLLPVCEKSNLACSEPPKIPNAIITNLGYQEVFVSGSQVQYDCKDGYDVEEDSIKIIYCIEGVWTEGPMCKPPSTCRTPITKIERCGARPNVSDGEVVQEGQAFLIYGCNPGYRRVGLDTVVCFNNGLWSKAPACHFSIDYCGTYPNISDGGVVEEAETFLKYGCNPGYRRVGSDKVVCYSNGTWSDTPTCNFSLDYCGARPNVSDSDVVEEGQTFLKYKCKPGFGLEGSDIVECFNNGTWSHIPTCNITISNCGDYPTVRDSDLVEETETYLRYRCHQPSYELVGPDTVVCTNSSTWSKKPYCRELYCLVDPWDYGQWNIQRSSNVRIREGGTRYLPCTWKGYKSRFDCINGRIRMNVCCDYEVNRDICP